jgi:hypothetical protein
MASNELEPEDDLLETGRPMPAWVRVVAAALAVLGLGFLGVRALTGGDSGRPIAAHQPRHAPVTAPPLLRFPGGPKMTGTIGCGPDLPPVQVSAAPGTHHTGLQLLVGGGVLQRVAFDTGRTARLHHLPQLHQDEWFDSIAAAAGATYATVSSVPCESFSGRVLAVHDDRTTIVPGSPASGIVADETRAWAVRDPPHVLAPLDGGRAVALPAGFAPASATRGQIVGNLVQAMDPTEIVSVDARSGEVRATSGASGIVVAAGHGRVYWTSGCAADRPCLLHSAAARGGAEHAYRLPAGPTGSPGLVSPDGRYLALEVRHVATDVSAQPRSPALDGDLAVLELRTGGVHVVPGVALSAGYRPSLAFAPHGWLVVGYERAGIAQLIAWRPGLPRPVHSPFHATSPAAPPITVLGR